MSADDACHMIALATQNAELGGQLSEVQEMLVETAVDAGELHARIEELQTELAEMRSERDVWRAAAQQREAGRAVA